MKILGIETSSKVCGAAICENGHIISEYYIEQPNVHAEKLICMIKNLLELSETRISSLSRIGVSAGPGSYTGLRIGLSTAKGLALPDSIPVVGVGTMDAMVYGLSGNYDSIWTAVHNLKNEVYAANFRKTDDQINRKSEYMCLTYEELSSRLKNEKEGTIITGKLLPEKEMELHDLYNSKIKFKLNSDNLFRPANIAIAAEGLNPDNGWKSLEPVYLKGFPVAD